MMMDCFKPNLVVTFIADLVLNVVFSLEQINIVLNTCNETIDLTTIFSLFQEDLNFKSNLFSLNRDSNTPSPPCLSVKLPPISVPQFSLQ